MLVYGWVSIEVASVNSRDIPHEFNMFGELFTIYKRYYYAERNDNWWAEMISAFRGLNKKYPTNLCKDLCTSCIVEIERRYSGYNKGLPDK